MKKFILIVAIALVGGFAANAQSRAIGARFGYGVEVSYQHYIGGNNFLEGDLGFAGFRGLNLAAAYNIIIAQPKWSKGEWGFYAGPAAGLVWDFPKQNANGGFGIGIGGNVGLEYIFEKTPIQLSIDWRPLLGPYFDNGAAFWTSGLFGGGISVRYFF